MVFPSFSFKLGIGVRMFAMVLNFAVAGELVRNGCKAARTLMGTERQRRYGWKAAHIHSINTLSTETKVRMRVTKVRAKKLSLLVRSASLLETRAKELQVV